jgi:putative flippase GtrA
VLLPSLAPKIHMIISTQLKHFLFIGLVAAFIDYLIYRSVNILISNISVAKSIGFFLGTIFAFLANSKITFDFKNKFLTTLIKFTFLYCTSMIINVFINRISLGFFPDLDLKVEFSFLISSIISAAINFIGLKFFVFK